MRYLLRVCTDESAQAALGPEESSSIEAEDAAFTEEIAGRGIRQGGERDPRPTPPPCPCAWVRS